MRVHIQKWGNSLALRIPKPFAEEASVRAGDAVDLSIIDGKLVAAPVVVRKYSLTSLLARVNKKNLHGEVDLGLRAGREGW